MGPLVLTMGLFEPLMTSEQIHVIHNIDFFPETVNDPCKYRQMDLHWLSISIEIVLRKLGSEIA